MTTATNTKVGVWSGSRSPFAGANEEEALPLERQPLHLLQWPTDLHFIDYVDNAKFRLLYLLSETAPRPLEKLLALYLEMV